MTHDHIEVLAICDLVMLMNRNFYFMFFFFQAEDGIRDTDRSRGLGDVYKRQDYTGI